MVLIEPGTASGFARIKDARAQVSRQSEGADVKSLKHEE